MSPAATKATPSARTHKTKARQRGRRDWRPAFLKALAEEGTVSAACALAKINRTTAYRERQRDEDFALAWTDVEDTVTDKLERKAVSLAMGGSERMLEFLLKARAPERYRDNVKVEHAGRIAHDHSGLEALSDDELLKRLNETP